MSTTESTMHPAENNMEAYLVVDLKNGRAFMSTAVWSLFYALEQGYKPDSQVDPGGHFGGLKDGLLVVPTSRLVSAPTHTELDFAETCRLYAINQ